MCLFALIFPTMSAPPDAQLSTAKGGKVAGVHYGQIEVAANTRNPLKIDFASELYLRGQTREPYTLELRAPKDGFIDMTAGAEPNPLVLRLAFSGSANGSFRVTANDNQDLPDSQIEVSAVVPEGTDFAVNEPNNGVLSDLTHAAGSSSVIYILFKQQTFLSRRSDANQTLPFVRIQVWPAEDNSAASGPYHALQAPNVVTLPSHSFSPAHVRWNDGEADLFLYPVTALDAPRNLVDMTGAALLTGALASENTWNIAPNRLPEGSGPVVSYIDQRALQRDDFWRQLLLLMSAAAIGASLTLMVDLILGRADRRLAMTAASVAIHHTAAPSVDHVEVEQVHDEPNRQ